MIIPELNTPTGFAGKDGFYWWIGQVETKDDPKRGNRYKVRIVGQHLKSCTAIPYEDLPWATILLPVTHPASLGNSNYTTPKLNKGDWVMGFFLDGATGQHPVIMGQMPRVFNTTKNDKLETTKPQDACLGFSNYVAPTNTAVAHPGGPAGAAAAARPGPTGTPPIVAAAAAEQGPSNPSGRYTCYPVADAGCKDNSTGKTKMEEALTEIFGSISKNGGQIGTNMLSDATGKVFDYATAARGYVTRVFGIANAYLRNAKFEMIKLLKKGVEESVKYLMGIPSPPQGSPKSGPVTKKKGVGFLGKLIQQLNESLSKINCEFADFEQRLLDFLTNLITDLLTEIVNAATCVIEAMISQVLSEIESFLTGIIDLVLGPVQAILGIIASPLNILGAALQYIFQMIGLSCTGPNNKCSQTTKLCTGSANKKKPGEDDFKNLDKIIADLESKGVTPLQTSCEEAYALPCPAVTTADVGGGTPGTGSLPGTPPPATPADIFTTSIPSDLSAPTTPPTDAPPTAPIFPPINVDIDSDATLTFSGREDVSASVGLRRIFSANSSGVLRLTGSSAIVFTPTITITPASLNFSLTSDKTRITASENISFTLTVTSGSVPDGTLYDYLMFGTIRNSDFVSNTTIGKIKMVGGVGVVTITLSKTLSITSDTNVIFSVLGPAVAKDFTIYTTVPVPPPVIPPIFDPPELGDPVVDNNGKILSIPIKNPGDPFLSPPFVTIYGAGFGGFASVELDDDGKLKKVKVDRPGTGYVPTITANDNCYIDGFIIIRPGYGYTSEPKIYVDGDATVVRAILNSAGNIVSVEVINKIKTFNAFPTIEIIGGGGMGAKAIPSLNCIEPTLYKKYVDSVAPSGVAEVVDCPNGDCDDCTV